MRILMLFLDGIGLGEDDPNTNPFAIAQMPTLVALTNNHRWLKGIGKQRTQRALFIPTDARLGVEGRPQSGTGQAAILTGLNVPQMTGKHYGPKPDAQTRAILNETNIFKQVVESGKSAALLEAYPPRWHTGVDSGKRLRASFQQAPHAAGLPTFGIEEYRAGEALSGDWTGEGWRTHLGFDDVPVYTPYEAGLKLVELSRRYDFAFHSHWMTDLVGHRGPLEDAIKLLETFDQVMAGVLDAWDDSEGVIIITSDHGNMEAIGDRRHTLNDVPTLIIGEQKDVFENMSDLTDIVPCMQQLLLP
ncbi:MAG: hypothetical protein D6712_01590 [Chloroflexi bacterium]|nr:MAG: hypothetical protein D6712_01590 [Chloroflexota bacterium]